MKRRNLIDHIISNGCILIREGGRHTIFYNPSAKKTSSVPRHAEINDFLAKKICRELGIEDTK